MGEVYRARDTRLKREVALKILPPSVAADSDRVARFAREAELLAALNHPNIANIYGVETSGGMQALVMELVEGEDLAARISRGAIPLDEALPIARQIIDALEAAHERGIVHRDLKPANIKLRPDGTVKVLDFGLAKAVDVAATGSGLSDNTMAGATITSPAMTQMGIIVGTAAYMSPEQARGMPADKRSDIWAFGCVLFEMLTGSRPFGGETISDMLASVLKSEPDLTALGANSTPAIQTLLRLCLTKPPARRLRDIGDARVFLDTSTLGTDSARTVTAPLVPVWRRLLPWVLAASMAIVAVAAIVALQRRSAPAAASFMFDIEASAMSADVGGFTLSPNGRYLAFVALDSDGVQRLRLRTLDDATPRVLAGTDGATSPFWSPDSREVAFFTTTTLRRIAIEGGATQQICRTVGAFASGGSWNADGVILFSRGSAGNGLFRVAAGGGEPQAVTTVRPPEEISHSAPIFLPDNRHFLYVKVMAGASLETSQLVWRSLDSGDEHVVRPLFSKALYVSPGYLIYRLPGALLSQPFDASTGKVTGEPVRIGPDVWARDSGAEAPMRAMITAASGLVAYRAPGEGALAALSWVDRSGAVLARVADKANYSNPSSDASGTRVMANSIAADSAAADLWLFDSRRNTATRFTFDPAMDSDAIFSPDGKSVVYYSARQPPGLYRKSSSGAGEETLLAATGAQTYPRDWTRDGRMIEFDKLNRPSTSIWFLPLEGVTGATAGKPFALAPGPYFHAQGHFSPDGRWLAYVSGESGRDEVFVQDFPPAGAKMQVSASGGIEPRWRGDGRELYYIAGDGKMMAVTVEGGPELRLGAAKPLFDTHFAIGTLPFPMRRFVVAPAGDRFLINVPIDQRQPPITVLTNWTSRLLH